MLQPLASATSRRVTIEALSLRWLGTLGTPIKHHEDVGIRMRTKRTFEDVAFRRTSAAPQKQMNLFGCTEQTQEFLGDPLSLKAPTSVPCAVSDNQFEKDGSRSHISLELFLIQYYSRHAPAKVVYVVRWTTALCTLFVSLRRCPWSCRLVQLSGYSKCTKEMNESSSKNCKKST
jgi:hypothetical protein